MITGQDDFVTRPFFESFQMDGCISNVRIISNNRFVGFQKPNCYGDGKIALARKYVQIRGVDLCDCAFYSDSISDLPLLKAVKYPVAVNPDPELTAVAEQCDWPIRYFTK
jgi:phosphoserine phosphatase